MTWKETWESPTVNHDPDSPVSSPFGSSSAVAIPGSARVRRPPSRLHPCFVEWTRPRALSEWSFSRFLWPEQGQATKLFAGILGLSPRSPFGSSRFPKRHGDFRIRIFSTVQVGDGGVVAQVRTGVALSHKWAVRGLPSRPILVPPSLSVDRSKWLDV